MTSVEFSSEEKAGDIHDSEGCQHPDKYSCRIERKMPGL